MTNVNLVNLLDVAMCRLRLPIPLVKLHMIHRLARALTDGNESSSQATWQTLLRWLRSLELESEVLEALLIVVMARGSAQLSAPALRAAINAPSVLSDLLIGHAFDSPVLVHSWLKCHSDEAPPRYKNPALTDELRRGRIVAPIMEHRMSALEERFDRPFIAQWTFEFERLIERSQDSDDGHFSYFDTSQDRNEASHLTARRGHLARSAFLRTLAFASDRWKMPVGLARAEAMFASPVDLSLLPVLPGDVPAWANVLHEARPGTSAEAADLVMSALEAVRANVGGALLHLSVPLVSDARYQADLEIVSVLASDERVDAQQVLHLHDWLPGRRSVPREPDLTLRIDRLEEEAAFPTKSGGFLRPVLLPLFEQFVGYLQPDLVCRMPRLPAHNSEVPLIVTPCEGGANVSHAGAHVGELLHWCWKWRPTHLVEMNGHTGVALVLGADVAARLLRFEGTRLVHVWRAHVRTREKDYGEWTDEIWTDSLPGLA